MLSSYFDIRARRQQEERRQEERRQDEERRQQDEERRRQDEERRRQDEERRREDEQRRHRELMALLVAAFSNGREQGNGHSQNELIQSLRQTIETLEAENARLRQEDGNESAQ